MLWRKLLKAIQSVLQSSKSIRLGQGLGGGGTWNELGKPQKKVLFF